jgi:hypothetical protein
MPRTGEKATLMVPPEMLAKARETWPETRCMSRGQILRFALAYALTNGNRENAIAATRDTRIGTKRIPKTE